MPVKGPTYVSRPLSDLSMAYSNPMSIRHGPFPLKIVTKKKGSIYILEPENLRKVNTGPRAYLAPAERTHWRPRLNPFDLDHHDLFDLYDANQERYDTDEVLDPTKAMTMTQTGQLEIAAEFDARDKCFDAADFNAGYTATPTTKWDAAGGQFAEDINDAATAVLKGCGMKANAMVVAGDVWPKLISLEDVVDRFKHTKAGDITKDMFTSIFEWLDPENLFVGEMINNPNEEGAVAANDFIWKGNVLVFHRQAGMVNAPMNEALPIGFGRSFEFERGRYVRHYSVDNPEANAVMVAMDYDHNVTEKNAGYLITNPVTIP